MIWRKHALERMLERGLSRDDVKRVLSRGEQIEDYPSDSPFPSGLFLATIGTKVIHIVAALDVENEVIYIISAYEPDEEHFETDMRIRRHRK